jgi:hypothetical protein
MELSSIVAEIAGEDGNTGVDASRHKSVVLAVGQLLGV